MDNLTNHLEELPTGRSLPDLDWLNLSVGDKPNNPTQNVVESIPELQEQWSCNTPKGITLTPNTVAVVKPIKKEFNKADIDGVVKAAKVAAMQGITGSGLASYLGKIYPQDLILASKDELLKVANEQGLLGNVYIDLSAFSSCKEAAHKLGSNKIRSAQYVVGECKHVCATHHNGHCSELKKTVVNQMEYTASLLDSYEKHLKIIGKIASDETIETKDALKEALLKSSAPKAENKAGDTEFTDKATSVSSNVKSRFEGELLKKEASIKASQAENHFEQARPVLAFIQDNMLKGKMGNSLKESISAKLSTETITKFAHEINNVVSLQGLLGNVYVDVSYYKNASEAIDAIRSASTSPQYLVQTSKASSFDDTLEVVARATGCDILPKDGKIDLRIAHSYIDDIVFTDRIAFDKGQTFKSSIEAGENVLGIIREAFIATMSHKKAPKFAGTQATLTSKGERKASVNVENLRMASYQSITGGVSIEDLEIKLASYLPAVEVAGLLDSVMGSVKEVHASVLTNCTTQKYAFRNDTKLIPSEKCAGCILNNKTSCLKAKLAFKGKEEAPTISGENLKDEYEVTGNEGLNISLRKQASTGDRDIDNDSHSVGLDDIMNTF